MLRNLQLSVKLTTDSRVDYLTATGLCPVTLDGRLREEHCTVKVITQMQRLIVVY